MSIWILTMLIHPAKDCYTHPSHRTLLCEKCSSKRPLRESTFLWALLLTDEEEPREPIMAPFTYGLPHHYPVIQEDGHSLYHWFSLSYTFHSCWCCHMPGPEHPGEIPKEREFRDKNSSKNRPSPSLEPRGTLRKGNDNSGVTVNFSGGS